MEIKGKTILSIKGSEGKEFLTISISSKGKDGKYTRVNVIVGIKDKEKVLEKMKSDKLSALLIDVQNGFLTANEFKKDGKKEKVIGAYISEYKVIEKYKDTKEDLTDDKLPF